MEWLTKVWDKLIRDVVLVTIGGGIGISQVFANPPHWQLLVFAGGLISPATVPRLLRTFGSQNGSSTPPSLPPGSSSLPPPSPGASGE